MKVKFRKKEWVFDCYHDGSDCHYTETVTAISSQQAWDKLYKRYARCNEQIDFELRNDPLRMKYTTYAQKD